jgi:hypothetical protein
MWLGLFNWGQRKLGATYPTPALFLTNGPLGFAAELPNPYSQANAYIHLRHVAGKCNILTGLICGDCRLKQLRN